MYMNALLPRLVTVRDQELTNRGTFLIGGWRPGWHRGSDASRCDRRPVSARTRQWHRRQAPGLLSNATTSSWQQVRPQYLCNSLVHERASSNPQPRFPRRPLWSTFPRPPSMPPASPTFITSAPSTFLSAASPSLPLPISSIASRWLARRPSTRSLRSQSHPGPSYPRPRPPS